MRILVTNVYSYQNKGDAAIVVALVNEIRRVFNSPQIILQTADKKNDQDKYGVEITQSLLWILLSANRKKMLPVQVMKVCGGLLTLLLYILIHRTLHLRAKFILNNELKEFIFHNEKADLVVACGGGYLRTASGSPKNSLLLSVCCLNFLVAKWLDKPVYLYSQSIGPVHGRFQRHILRRTLNKVDLVETRETTSLSIVKKSGVKAKTIMTADAVFTLSSKNVKHYNTSRLKNMQIGITVRHWFSESHHTNGYIRTIAETVDYLIESYDATITHLPQVIASKFDDDDRVTARKVMELVKNKQKFILLEDDLSPQDLINYCGRFYVFIGTRMHSNIFALLSEVPVVAIGYEHKTQGIMDGMGLSDQVIDINTVTWGVLTKKIDYLMSHRSEYHNKIHVALVKQKKAAMSAIIAIKEDYFAKT